MRRRFLPLLLLSAAAALVTFGLGTATVARADGTDTPTHGVVPDAPYAVWDNLPGESTVQLAGPAGFAYYLFDETGTVLMEEVTEKGKTFTRPKILPGDAGWGAFKIILSLQHRNANNHQPIDTDGFYIGISSNQWVKLSTGVTLDLGGENLSHTTSGGLPFSVNYVDANGKVIRDPLVVRFNLLALSTSSAFGKILTTMHSDLENIAPAIDGYTYDKLTQDGLSFTFHYTGIKSTGGNTGTTTGTPATSSPAPTQPTPVVKGTAIYATKKIGLYRTTQFTPANRKIWYVKKPRTQRPQFIVTNHKYSKNGTMRYRIRDINHNSLTNDRRGYITANSQYVQPLYYQSQPTKIKVIAAKGLNGYHHVDLSGQVARHYKRGSVLKVTAIRDYHLTTRLMLANGQYVSGNKTLVIKK